MVNIFELGHSNITSHTHKRLIRSMSNIKNTKNKSSGTFEARRKSSNSQIHFMGDFKGKVIVAPTGILRHERSLQDQMNDHQIRLEEMDAHKRLLSTLRDKLTPAQLNRLISGPAEQSPPRGDSQRSEAAGSSSPPQYKPLEVSPTKRSSSAAMKDSPSRGAGDVSSPSQTGPETLRGAGLASLLSIIRTSLVMEGLLVSGPNGLQPKSK
jgi:hypothetical protein